MNVEEDGCFERNKGVLVGREKKLKRQGGWNGDFIK